jgi:hypothetical protein
MQQIKRWNTVNSGNTQRIKKLGIVHTPMNLVNYAKALAANPTIHLPPVAPPPVPLVLPHNLSWEMSDVGMSARDPKRQT